MLRKCYFLIRFPVLRLDVRPAGAEMFNFSTFWGGEKSSSFREPIESAEASGEGVENRNRTMQDAISKPHLICRSHWCLGVCE